MNFHVPSIIWNLIFFGDNSTMYIFINITGKRIYIFMNYDWFKKNICTYIVIGVVAYFSDLSVKGHYQDYGDTLMKLVCRICSRQKQYRSIDLYTINIKINLILWYFKFKKHTEIHNIWPTYDRHKYIWIFIVYSQILQYNKEV